MTGSGLTLNIGFGYGFGSSLQNPSIFAKTTIFLNNIFSKRYYQIEKMRKSSIFEAKNCIFKTILTIFAAVKIFKTVSTVKFLPF